MMFIIPTYVVALATVVSATSYTLTDSYNSTNFFSGFDFFDSSDPTHGYVTYTSATTANEDGLAGYVDQMVYLGVDHVTSDPSGSGRASTRVTSQKSWTHGLFIADVEHMPVGCGVWPAFWTLGPDWPSGGEIDIIEGVNSQTTDIITLHTSAGCTMSNSADQLSSTYYSDDVTSLDCGADGGSDGCAQYTTDETGYGTGFNSNGGGIYAMEWTSEAISVWFFARGTTLANALGGTDATSGTAAAPDTSTFGTPTASFSGCDIDANFKDHQIVFNTALCGDWAGNSWSDDATCAAEASTCDAYVAANPTAFVDAYWLINRVSVYSAASSSSKRSEPPSRGRRDGMRPVPFHA